MKTKKILSLTLSMIFIIVHTLSVFPVNALDNILEYKSVAMVYNDSVLYINVAIDSEENIYMTADDISKYTPFTYYSDSESFIYDKQDVNNLITKEIQIDIDNKMLYIYNNWINVIPTIIPQQLSGVYQQEDNLYLPIAEIFPCLDTCIDVSDEKLIVIPSTSTLSNTLCNINVNDYLFDMYYSETKIAEFICTLYEDLSNLRISRLPIIRSTFNYTETQHYKDVFTDYLLDNSVYYEAINEVISSKETIAKSLIDNLEKYKDEADYAKFSYIPSWLATTVIDVNAMDKSEEWGFDKKVEGTLGTIEKASDGFYDLVSTYTAYQFHIADHLCMLNSVYDVEDKSPKYSLFMSKNETEAYAAKIIYEKYSSELVNALFNAAAETIGENIVDKLKELSTQKLSELLNVHLNSYLIEIEKATINKVFPSFTTTAENFEILPYHYKITNTALSKYNMNRIILVGESYGERINNTRLNLLLYLTSSKYCYKAIQNSAKAKKNDSLNNICTNNINQIDELLTSLYLAAFSIEQDSYENLDSIIETNRQAIINLELLELYEPVNAFDLYKQFFENNYQLSDLVCLADVTHDGIDEMIIVTEGEYKGNPKFTSSIKGIVYTINNGEIVKIYEKNGTASHLGGFEWYLTQDGNLEDGTHSMWHGTGEQRFEEYYLTNSGERIEIDTIVLSDKTSPVSENGEVTDEAYRDYVDKINKKVEQSFLIYSSWSSATVLPQFIELDPRIIFNIEEKSNDEIDEIPYYGKRGVVSTENTGLNLRKYASSYADVILEIPQNASLTILESPVLLSDNNRDDNKWLLVDYNDNIGYVCTDYIKTTNEKVSLSERQLISIAQLRYYEGLNAIEWSMSPCFEQNWDVMFHESEYIYTLLNDVHTKEDWLDNVHMLFSEKYDDFYKYDEIINMNSDKGYPYYLEKEGDWYENDLISRKGALHVDLLFSDKHNIISIAIASINDNEVFFNGNADWSKGNNSQMYSDYKDITDFSIVYEDGHWKCGKITGYA